MKIENFQVIRALLVISAVFLFIGMYSDQEIMKMSTVALIILATASFYFSRATAFYIGNEKMRMHLAIASAYSFFAMVLIGCALFILNLVMHVPNITYALFGAAFVGLILGREYIARELKGSIKK